MVTDEENGHGKTEIEFWARLFAFHITLILLRKVFIRLWVNSRADCAL